MFSDHVSLLVHKQLLPTPSGLHKSSSLVFLHFFFFSDAVVFEKISDSAPTECITLEIQIARTTHQ